MDRSTFIQSLLLLPHDLTREARFSVAPGYFRVGQLFHVLNSASHTNYLANDRDMVAGEYLFASTKDCTRAELEQAMVHTFSYKGALWRWEETENRTRLRQPTGARNLAAQLHEKVLSDYIDYAEKTLSDPESASQFDNYTKADKAESIKLLEAFQKYCDTRERRQAFFSSGGNLRVPFSELPDTLKKLSLDKIQEAVSRGASLSREEPKWVSFHASPFMNNITPSFFVEIDSLGGQCHIGGKSYEARVQQSLERDWILKGDQQADPRDSLQIPSHPGEDALELLARVVPNLLARLRYGGGVQQARQVVIVDGQPTGYRPGFLPASLAAGKTVGEFREALRSFPGGSIRSKWHGSFLLLSYPAWVAPDPYIPWSAIEPFLKAKQSKQLPFTKAYFSTAAALDDTGMQTLEREFPTMKTLRQWRSLLALCATSPSFEKQFRGDTGISLREAATKTPLPFELQSIFRFRKVERIRLVQNETALPGRRLGIEMFDTTKTFCGTLFFPESQPYRLMPEAPVA